MTVTAMVPKLSVADASATQAERPLDLVHLSRYTLGNRSLEVELLGLFRAQAGVYVARLQDAANEKEWKDAAHSLKGSARGLGAWALGDIAEEAERRAGDDAAGRAYMIGRIRDAIDTVNLYIDELMA
ncbi:Hpt domain-containing protein [Parvibaculum sp.]|jgi:HPt (histidine-containing phosphotransfer) domain-containing protein|uniref:Hpt domain-containing protein n=1 Tax=Parvibaculum sp. TaxID=2024848 RepID=UPI002B9E3658|nr:Hpt domain-containing protein [Parvibaculum sp.]HUD52166.1 Hpt domain-containing protein [Parvibaculum sp.]